MSKMTQQEALKEAQKRWGPNGHAFHFPNRAGLPKGTDYCVGSGYGTRGEGNSWEAAFADADRREKAMAPTLDEIDALVCEVAPPPLCVSRTAIEQLRPLLVELLQRRKAMGEQVWSIEARWRSAGPDAPWIPQADYMRLTKEDAGKKVAELTARNTLSEWRTVRAEPPAVPPAQERFPKCMCGGIAVTNASGDITRTCIRCGSVVFPIARKETPVAEESQTQRLILDWLAAKRILAFRMNSGAVKTDKRFFRFGVAGMADILAFPEEWQAITPTWIEVKAAKGRQSEFQKSFQRQVEEAGHRYILAKSVDDVIAALGGLDERHSSN